MLKEWYWSINSFPPVWAMLGMCSEPKYFWDTPMFHTHWDQEGQPALNQTFRHTDVYKRCAQMYCNCPKKVSCILPLHKSFMKKKKHTKKPRYSKVHVRTIYLLCSNMTALLWELIAWEQHSGQVFSFWCALKQLHAIKTWSRSSGSRVWESLFHYQVIPLLLLLNFKTKWCKSIWVDVHPWWQKKTALAAGKSWKGLEERGHWIRHCKWAAVTALDRRRKRLRGLYCKGNRKSAERRDMCQIRKNRDGGRQETKVWERDSQTGGDLHKQSSRQAR